MNWLKRSVLSRFYSPELTRAVEAAGGLRESVRALDLTREVREEWNAAKLEMRKLGEESSFMRSGPRSVPLKERFWELELALEDRGWKRQFALSALEFSRYGIQQLILISRLYFLKNPIIKRAVLLNSFYTFGRGVEISSEDDDANQVCQDFMEANKKELGHLGLMEKNQTLKTDGNLYVIFFTGPLKGSVLIRTIDATEIEEIITDPNDQSQAWYYQRRWTQESFDPVNGVLTHTPCEQWYPALRFNPPDRPATIRGKKVNWDQPIYHRKTGGLPKWKYGAPEVYATLDWARAYKGFLEDWSTITKALARFAYNIETQGGQQAIQQFSQILSSTLGDGGTQIEYNPPPVVAASFVSGPGNKITPIKTAGATTEPEQGRRVAMMACSAEGLPETMMLGDASTGSLATAESLDRPTELMFLARQEMWREMLIDWFTYVLECSQGASGGKLKEANGGKVRRIVECARHYKPNGQWYYEATKKQPSNDDITIKVIFPSVLEHDIGAAITAIVTAGTLENKVGQIVGIDERIMVGLLLAELGVENVDEVLEAMYPTKGKDAYDPDRTKEEIPAPLPTKGVPNPGGGPQVPGGEPQAPGQNAPAPVAPAPSGAPAPAAKEAQLKRACELLMRVIERMERRESAEDSRQQTETA